MARSPYRHGSRRNSSRIRRRLIALTTAAAWFTVFSWTPIALAVPAIHGGALPGVKLFPYASGPAQHGGTAAGKAHYVPASATRAAPSLARIHGHRAPKPNLAPPAMGTPALVHTGSARLAPGRDIVGHPAARPARPGSGGVAAPAVTGPDNATYAVAPTFDTVPQHCGSYTIQQFAPTINEQEPLPGTDVDSQTPSLTVSATVPGGFPANPTFSFAFEILAELLRPKPPALAHGARKTRLRPA